MRISLQNKIQSVRIAGLQLKLLLEHIRRTISNKHLKVF